MRIGRSEATREKENMIHGDDKKSNKIQVLLLWNLPAMLTFPVRKSHIILALTTLMTGNSNIFLLFSGIMSKKILQLLK